MANPGDFAYTVKQQADIVRIVGDYVKLKKSGGQNFTGLCPFHQEKTPSFSVHATRQFYHCFGCGKSGDVFDFIQKTENITFPEAVRLVAQKLGIPIPKATFNSEAEASEARLRGALLDMHEKACAWFQEQLRRPEAAHARAYLVDRGLKEETIARFRIGYAPDSGFLLRDWLRRDFDEERQRASGLFSWKEQLPERVVGRQPLVDSSRQDERPSTAHQPATNAQQPTTALLYAKFRNRVMFPICNEAGRTIAFTGRTLATDEKQGPKYLNSPETAIYSKSHVLFNLDKAKEAIRKLDYSILVEGQMDCISVFAAGPHNVIASSGTAFTEAQARLLARFSRNIVVNFDPDTAGAAAAERSLAMLVGQEFQIKVVTLEQGYDPDLYVRKKGFSAYEAALRRAPTYFDYLIEQAQKRFPRSPQGKAQAVSFLSPHVQRVPNRIVRDELANEIAQKLGIDSAVLRQEFKHVAMARGAQPVRVPVTAQLTKAERILIRALASPAELLSGEPVSARDESEAVFDPTQQARLVFSSERLHERLASESLVEELLRANGADPLALPLGEADRSLLASALLLDESDLTPEEMENAIVALRHKKHLHLRDQELRQRIVEAERRQDHLEVARLAKEKLELDRVMAAAR
ncbi:MAG: CHC2 zinc finger domain-containing protein [Terriglobales bacterium]|jgi:DNA primase